MAKKPSRSSVKNISATRLVYPTRPVPLRDAFRRNSPVPQSDLATVEELAAELQTPIERLQPLLEHRYLKLVEAKEYLKDTIVARPLPAAMDWLRMMFAPTMMQPIFTIEMVSDLLRCPKRQVRNLCILHNVPLHLDPAFGELMSVRHFNRLYRALYAFEGPARYDRQALLFLCHLKALINGASKPKKVLPYSRRVEAEITRVAKMPEPERSFRAIALLEAYDDAKTIAECLEKYGRIVRENVDRVEAKLTELRENFIGQPSGEPGASSSGQSDLDEPESTDGSE